jgi:mannosyltransferase
MEAAGALGRGILSTYVELAREKVRSRTRTFWIVAGITAVAVGLRVATLGLQTFHHDEVVTTSRVLRGSFWHAMDAVGFSESAPPLYYVLAWLWTQFAGSGEFGLRSFSALAGVMTVPFAYLLAVELGGRRTGIAAAALVAVNPMLIWYSQEARGYALMVLLTTIAALYFVRALDRGQRRNYRGWGIASALALATHYFAIFPIALEALWLLRRRGREAMAGLWIVVGMGLLLAPLAIHQMLQGHAEWISDRTLGHRLWETGFTFAVGEIGDVIARPERPVLGILPVALIVVALTLLYLRGDRRARLGGGRVLAIAAATVAIPLLIGLLAPSKDYVLARNLLPALVPLLVAVSIGLTLPSLRRIGASLCAVLVAYSLVFSVWTNFSPALQRPDWDAVAAHLGDPESPRAMVTWTLGLASLRHYLKTGSYQVAAEDKYRWYVHEINFISDGPAPPVPAHLLDPAFRQVGYEKVGRLYVRSYALPGPDLAHLYLRKVRDASLNFRSNGVLVDGIGPG